MITRLEGNTGQQKLSARGNICFSSDFTTTRHLKLIPAAFRSEVQVFSGSTAGNAGTNPVEGMEFTSRVCPFLRSGQLITRSEDLSFGRVRRCVCRIVSNF